MDENEGFDWLPEQQEAIRRQERRDLIAAVVALLVVIGVYMIGG